MSARAAVPVTFVSSYGRLGGSEIYLERLLQSLEPKWVRSIVSLGSGPLEDRLRATGHSVTVIEAGRSLPALLRSATALRRVLRAERARVVHANGLKAALVCAVATMGTKIRVLWLKHDFSMDGWRARLLARRCAQIVGVSNSVMKTFGARPAGKLHVVHTGLASPEIDPAAARRVVNEAVAVSEEAKVVGLVGHLVPGKGHNELLEIVTSLSKRVPGFHLAIVGGVPAPVYEPYSRALRDQVKELAISDRVTFLGHRDDAVQIMSGCDVVAMPSVSDHEGVETEAFPLVALEAMATGTPLIGYAVGGMAEVVGECGRLVAPRDRVALENELVTVLADDELRDRLATCGVKRAGDLYSLERMVEGLKVRYVEASAR